VCLGVCNMLTIKALETGDYALALRSLGKETVRTPTEHLVLNHLRLFLPATDNQDILYSQLENIKLNSDDEDYDFFNDWLMLLMKLEIKQSPLLLDAGLHLWVRSWALFWHLRKNKNDMDAYRQFKEINVIPRLALELDVTQGHTYVGSLQVFWDRVLNSDDMLLKAKAHDIKGCVVDPQHSLDHFETAVRLVETAPVKPYQLQWRTHFVLASRMGFLYMHHWDKAEPDYQYECELAMEHTRKAHSNAMLFDISPVGRASTFYLMALMEGNLQHYQPRLSVLESHYQRALEYLPEGKEHNYLRGEIQSSFMRFRLEGKPYTPESVQDALSELQGTYTHCVVESETAFDNKLYVPNELVIHVQEGIIKDCHIRYT